MKRFAQKIDDLCSRCEASWAWMVIIVASFSVLRLIVASNAGLVSDEAYYWLWSKHLANGYFDHPPMVAWLIALGTGIFDDQAVFVRLAFVITTLVTSVLTYDTAKILFENKIIARRSVIWLNASLLMGVGGFLATPDAPSVMFYTAGVWALARLLKGAGSWWWLVFGAMAGLGVEAKYTNLFLGLGVLYWFMLDASARRALMTPWPYLGGVVALLVMWPNIYWNINHDWASVDKQFGRLDSEQFTTRFAAQFVYSQIILINVFVFVFVWKFVGDWWKSEVCPPIVVEAKRSAKLLISLSFPLIIYMFLHVFHDRIQGNWPAPIYPILAIMAAVACENTVQKHASWVARLAAPFGLGLVFVSLLYLLSPKSLVNFYDPTDMSRGWGGVVQEIEDQRQMQGADFIATAQYGLMGQFSYHLRDEKTPIIAVAERQRYAFQDLGVESALVGKKAIIVNSLSYNESLSRCFSDIKALGTLKRIPHGGRKNQLQLYSGRLKFAGCSLE